MDGCRLSVSRISQRSIAQLLGATNAISFRSWTDCTHRSLASTQNAFQHVASGRRGGSEDEGRRDRGRFGSIGGCWNDSRPRSDGKAFSGQERPIDVHLSQPESFVERARKRLIAHEAARQQLVPELEESEARLARFRDVAAQAPRHPLRFQKWEPR